MAAQAAAACVVVVARLNHREEAKTSLLHTMRLMVLAYLNAAPGDGESSGALAVLVAGEEQRRRTAGVVGCGFAARNGTEGAAAAARGMRSGGYLQFVLRRRQPAAERKR
ncbi:hypothetical protein PR202_ga19357 [Eleusine coracana subsp. coracana]|uniref:Uncharacterized protein n=1 Tax=Eleusine coracana subsp. coracana TaxID=191504 RepID=A0AAV5CVC8_ELECO|nr:hypothetical protein PR202_ga19357 [Eleusine coracana subsp. coracana]